MLHPHKRGKRCCTGRISLGLVGRLWGQNACARAQHPYPLSPGAKSALSSPTELLGSQAVSVSNLPAHLGRPSPSSEPKPCSPQGVRVRGPRPHRGCVAPAAGPAHARVGSCAACPGPARCCRRPLRRGPYSPQLRDGSQVREDFLNAGAAHQALPAAGRTGRQRALYPSLATHGCLCNTRSPPHSRAKSSFC